MKYIKSIFKSLLFALLLPLSVSVDAQINSTAIKLNNGPVFNRQSIIGFQIECSQNCYYYVGLEKVLNGTWREIMLDISLKATSKEAVLKRALGNRIARGQLSIQNIPAAYLGPNNGLYRFKLRYGPSPATISKVALSNEFTVKQN